LAAKEIGMAGFGLSRFRSLPALLACLAVAACTTTEDAERSLAGTWPGRPADSFFAAYGPPAASYKLSDGRVIYTWRGGRLNKYIPPDYQIVRRDPFYDPMFSRRYGPGFDPWYDDPQMVMVSPGRDVTLQCEAQITVDRARIIQSIRLSGDTEGDGVSRSRCAEVFGVRK
jgi:hypothetical protein